MFTLKPEGDITITITIVQKPLKTFARKSEKEEDFFWKKNCWFEKKDKKSRLRIADTHSSDRGAAAFICYLFFTLYSSLFKEKENRSRVEKSKKENQIEDCSVTLEKEELHLFALKPMGNYFSPLPVEK